MQHGSCWFNYSLISVFTTSHKTMYRNPKSVRTVFQSAFSCVGGKQLILCRFLVCVALYKRRGIKARGLNPGLRALHRYNPSPPSQYRTAYLLCRKWEKGKRNQLGADRVWGWKWRMVSKDRRLEKWPLL